MKEEDKFEASTTHRRWIESQGIPILSEFSVPNLKEIKVGPWERLGASGAYVIFNAIDDILDAYILELDGGGTVKPERHMYEEIVYVLSGRGAATIWNEGGPKRTFECMRGVCLPSRSIPGTSSSTPRRTARPVSMSYLPRPC